MILQKDKNDIQIIFIAGYGHIGSTILEKYLSKHEEIFALGESKHLTFNKNKTCSCKKKVAYCNYWKHIVKYKNFKILNGYVSGYISRFNYILKLLKLFFSKEKKTNYNIVKKYTKKKIRFITDSSKDPLALIDCIKKNKKNIYVLFCKRYIFDIIKSYNNKKRISNNLDIKKPFIVFLEYYLNNFLIFLILKTYNIKFIVIHNYELRQNPLKILRKIFNFIKVKNKFINFKSKVNENYHSIEGNINRFKM